MQTHPGALTLQARSVTDILQRLRKGQKTRSLFSPIPPRYMLNEIAVVIKKEKKKRLHNPDPLRHAGCEVIL